MILEFRYPLPKIERGEVLEKRKRGRPKVDTHLTEGHYDNRRKELNYKYMFEGTGVLIDAAEEIPEKHILYEVDHEHFRFKACKTGILEQLGRLRIQDNADLEDCVIVANFAIDAIKAGVGVKEITVAIRKLRTALKKYSADEENEFLRMEFRRALYELRELGGG